MSSNPTAYYLWYGLKIGLGYERTMYMPVGELLSLAAVEQIKHEGAKPRLEAYDEAAIPDVL